MMLHILCNQLACWAVWESSRNLSKDTGMRDFLRARLGIVLSVAKFFISSFETLKYLGQSVGPSFHRFYHIRKD